MEWIMPPEIAATGALRERVGGHPLVADILTRRGIVEPDEALAFLDPGCYQPAISTDLPDLDAAASRLVQAIQRSEHILVWGDFDVDGQTSTALLVEALRDLGADVSYHIPLRLAHGHGVSADILREYISQGIQVVLTCDTGVAEFEAADTARAAGVPMIVTDHHALPETLPNTPAIVNPQRLPVGHPLRDLPGVGVAYKLVETLYALAGRDGDEKHLLDLVALGIVADVATLHHDTRYLLQLGIDALRTPHRVGLRALMRSAQVDPTSLSADTIGYQVGPRLNALGRLDDARLSVELLTTDDEVRAQQIAAHLELLNNRRKQIDDQIYAAAQEQIARDPSLLDFDALVLDSPNWHAGVIGIVATRLAEQYQRPTVLLVSPEGQPARGSARSVPGVDIISALVVNEHLLMKYGGHAGAAGLTLDADLIPQFRRQLSNTVRETRRPDVVEGKFVDAIVSLNDLTMELAQELNRLAPFGEGNPPVTLMIPELTLAAHATFGFGGRHRRLTVEDAEGASATIIWWRGSDYSMPAEAFDVLLVPRINDFKGTRSLQLEWVDSRPLPGAEVETRPRFQLIDCRREPEPATVLPADAPVWAEALSPEVLPAPFRSRVITRASIPSAPVLIIWTSPPGPQELSQLLEETQAHIVYVLGQDAAAGTPSAFLERLAGLVKYAQRAYGGNVSVVQLATVVGQREVTVRRGLDWLAAKGQVTVKWLDADRAQVTPGGVYDEAAIEPLQDAIRALLAEADAYRAYFRQANLEPIFEP